MRDTHREQDQKETGRVEAFSDGLFAFAITLLVLNLKVPDAADLSADHGLLGALRAQWPSYLAYLISFLTILIMWMNHHKLFQFIQRVDHNLLLFNGLLLLGVTVEPFTTSLLASYIMRPDARVAAAVYSGTFVWIALFYNVMWGYAVSGGRLLHRDHDRHRVRKITQQYMFGPAFYIVAFIADFVNVTACVVICLLLAVFFAIPETWLGRKPVGPP